MDLEQTESVPQMVPDDEHSRLVDVAKKATDETPEPDAVETKPEPTQIQTRSVAKILKEREERQRMREEVHSYAEQARAELAAAKKAREEAEQYIQEQKQILDGYKKDPFEVGKKLGWNDKDILEHYTRQGDPNYEIYSKLQSQNETLAKQLEEISGWKKQQETAYQEQQRLAEERAYAHSRETAVGEFLDHAAESKCPNMWALWDKDEIIAKADQVFEAYKQKTKGELADLGEIAQYLEEQATDKLAKLRGGTAKPEDDGKKPPKEQPGKSGTRTLSTQNGSERRSMPKPIAEMTREEEEEHLISIARSAAQKST